MDAADLVILVPMLGRPHRVRPLLGSIEEATPGARVLWLLSEGDHKVRQAVGEVGGEILSLPFRPVGDYAHKINTGYRHTTEPLMFLAADDLRFHPGWFQAACAKLTPGISVVGTNDLGSPRVVRGEHSTHSMVTREYADRYGTIDQPGAILHEGYAHEFVDDEFVETAKYRRAWAFAVDAKVEHLHPNWGKTSPDRLYAQQQARMRYGRPIYQRRRKLWT